jgi:serine/threonine protein kinase
MVFTAIQIPQTDLEELGVGAAGVAYKVDDHAAPKTCHVSGPPPTNAPARERSHYASQAILYSNIMQDERTVFRLLEQRPDSNIVEAIDTDRAEGIYLRKYLPIDKLEETPTQPGRILWYQDIIRALVHIYGLGIAHSDLRIDNILCDRQGHALLCDFSASSPFGKLNPDFPHSASPVPINGLSEVVSGATDRFAMGSVIFRMEIGAKPELSVGDDGAIVLPQVQTGHDGIGTMIRKAWLGQYGSTSQMLEHADSLHSNLIRDTPGPTIQSVSREALRDRVKQWRECLCCVAQHLVLFFDY